MSGWRCYATLAQIHRRNRIDQPSPDASDDARILDKIRAASEWVENYTNRIFQPVIDTRKFDWYNSYSLSFRGYDLLSLTSIVDGAGATIPSAAIIFLGDANDAVGPYYGVELNPTSGYLLYTTTKRRCISVAGVWGFHDDYANAFRNSNLTVSGSLSATATAVPLSADPSVTTDAWGMFPAISAGHLIQVDTEFMHVITTPGVPTGTLTVIRGANGSTAATHSNGAIIQTYEPPRDLNDAVLQLSAAMIEQDRTDFGKVTIDAMGNKIVAQWVPKDIWVKLDPYVKVRVGQ